MGEATISETINTYLEIIKGKRQESTIRAYRYGCNLFIETLTRQGINPSVGKVSLVKEDWIKYFIEDLLDDHLAPKTIRVYVHSVKKWYDYISETHSIALDPRKIKKLIEDSAPKDIPQNPTAPDFNDVSRIISFVSNLKLTGYQDGKEQLRAYRDKALLMTLADTGLDVEEICSLQYRNVDWKKKVFVLEKKSRKQTVDISRRALKAISEYTKARSSNNANFSRNADSHPLFARHDKGAGIKVHPITTSTVRNIVKERAKEAFGDEIESIDVSPIWFRYYFEKTISQSFQVLLHPKIMERCQELFEDGHYESAVFNAMKVIEEEIRGKSGSKQNDYGSRLVSNVMAASNNPKLVFSSDKDEQEAAHALYRGAIGFFKNPSSHRFVDNTDHVKALECLAYASLLIRMLDEI